MTRTADEQQVIDEALRVLLTHMEPSKVALFLATWNADGGELLAARGKLFGDLPVDELVARLHRWRATRAAE